MGLLKRTIKTHQSITIAGQVLEGETNRPISGATVMIVEKPEKFGNWLSLRSLQYGLRWETMNNRPDQQLTAEDGYFYFVDLPGGEYVLEASLLTEATRYDRARETIQVPSSNQNEQKIITKVINFILSPTGIKGVITDNANKTLPYARIQIQDGQQHTFSDSDGNYRLLGLEPSKSNLTFIFSASGYKQASKQVKLAQGKVVVSNLSLRKS